MDILHSWRERFPEPVDVPTAVMPERLLVHPPVYVPVPFDAAKFVATTLPPVASGPETTMSSAGADTPRVRSLGGTEQLVVETPRLRSSASVASAATPGSRRRHQWGQFPQHSLQQPQQPRVHAIASVMGSVQGALDASAGSSRRLAFDDAPPTSDVGRRQDHLLDDTLPRRVLVDMRPVTPVLSHGREPFERDVAGALSTLQSDFHARLSQSSRRADALTATSSSHTASASRGVSPLSVSFSSRSGAKSASRARATPVSRSSAPASSANAAHRVRRVNQSTSPSPTSAPISSAHASPAPSPMPLRAQPMFGVSMPPMVQGGDQDPDSELRTRVQQVWTTAVCCSV